MSCAGDPQRRLRPSIVFSRKATFALILLACSLRAHLPIANNYYDLYGVATFDDASTTTTPSTTANETESTTHWLNTAGVELYDSRGDAKSCRDVIYTADTRLPTANDADDESKHSSSGPFVRSSWGAMSFAVGNFSAFRETCAAYFRISPRSFDGGSGRPHSVWGRLPATALAMSHFPNATIFLYVDTDAMLAGDGYGPGRMYDALVREHWRDRGAAAGNATSAEQPALPSLVVNKPTRGWLCRECKKFELGHGCFNTGALLWRRSPEARLILRAWWESRLDNVTRRFPRDADRRLFHGWEGDFPYSNKMSEQNRLMYVYGTNPDVARNVLPVPRRGGAFSDTPSCPEKVDDAHVPCLQDDFAQFNAFWNRTRTASCFVNHFADRKDLVRAVFRRMVSSAEKEGIRKRLYPLVERIQRIRPERAVDIVNFMMGQPNTTELLRLLDSPEALNATIEETLGYLDDAKRPPG